MSVNLLMQESRDWCEAVIWRIITAGKAESRNEVMGRRGLRSLREQWWTQLQYESGLRLWRNVLLLESSPEPREATANFPDNVRIGVYSPGHIGDILHTVPLLRALRVARPRASISWIVGPWSVPVASRYRYADKVNVFSPAWRQYRRQSRGTGLREQITWGKARDPVDVFISTANSDVTTLYVGRSLQPAWWCGRKPSCDLYPVARRYDLRTMERDVPEAEDILRLAEPLGIHGPATLEYLLTSDEEDDVVRLLHSLGVKKPYVVLAPGAGWKGKQWPADRWARVADHITEVGMTVILVGTGSETHIVGILERHAGKKLVNLAGKTQLPLLAGLIANAALWLGSDSGGLHLAASLGTPSLSLFGPTSPAKWAPKGARNIVLRAVDNCPDCHPWHPKARCMYHGTCMLGIEVEHVVNAFNHWVKNSDNPSYNPELSITREQKSNNSCADLNGF